MNCKVYKGITENLDFIKVVIKSLCAVFTDFSSIILQFAKGEL